MARILSFLVGSALLAGTVGLYVMDPDRLVESLFLSVFAFAVLGGAFVSGKGSARDGAHRLARAERNVVLRAIDEPGSVVNGWILGLLLTVLFGAAAREVFTNPRHAHAPGPVKLATVVLLTAGILVLVRATLKTIDYAMFGRVDLRLALIPIPTGSTLRAQVEIAKLDSDHRQLKATLACVETTWREIGMDDERHLVSSTSELWSLPSAFPIAPIGGGGRADLSFDIPADLPGTSQPGTFGLDSSILLGQPYHEWRLQLGEPSRTFILPVRKPSTGAASERIR